MVVFVTITSLANYVEYQSKPNTLVIALDGATTVGELEVELSRRAWSAYSPSKARAHDGSAYDYFYTTYSSPDDIFAPNLLLLSEYQRTCPVDCQVYAVFKWTR